MEVSSFRGEGLLGGELADVRVGGGPDGGGGLFTPLGTDSLFGMGEEGRRLEVDVLEGGASADVGGATGGAVDGGGAWPRGKRGGISGLLLGEVEGGLCEELPFL